MWQQAVRSHRWTRRAFLSIAATPLLTAASERGRVFDSEFRRYPDPGTELEVLRLTDPKASSFLTAYFNRGIARRGGFLLFSNDRTASQQVYRLDLKTGEQKLLTDAGALDPASLSLFPDDRSFTFWDGPTLRVSAIGTQRDRDLYTVPEGWTRGKGGALTRDGVSALFVEGSGAKSRLQLLNVARKTVTTLTAADFAIEDPQPRPKRDQVFYRQGNEALWVVNFTGQQNRRLRLPEGAIGPAHWSPDGKTILYLHYPSDRGKLNAIREYTVDENADKLVANTSQFVHFAPNGDSSVFAGASRNVGGPYILILLRVTRRELTLCEHRASVPAAVAPVFSPNSQEIYFQSDRHGKPAIYRIKVEKFVEETDDET